ncbi:hypothetical protein [Flavobacterium hungaricum]|uniref:PH domain-containing protein n=1 Tax=Flavobacterium hungaricum TaxID=2082725 RepID=A0ABR9TM76_9FLAO|nr:hypothetical protein [Flavobacterium hungaricum]MBE8726415.1 hypothetical protein [Flavobacterium hungaricum]
MKFTKEERKFWQKQFRIESAANIPKDWTFFKSKDGDEDDDFFYFFTLRVNSITDIYLKETLITDRAVEYFVHFKDLKSLIVRRHSHITKASILYFNQMQGLELLNVTRTAITLTDLCENLNNQSLKEVFVSSQSEDGQEKDLLEKAFILKQRMPNCNVYLDLFDSTDHFGNPEKPIF